MAERTKFWTGTRLLVDSSNFLEVIHSKRINIVPSVKLHSSLSPVQLTEIYQRILSSPGLKELDGGWIDHRAVPSDLLASALTRLQWVDIVPVNSLQTSSRL